MAEGKTFALEIVTPEKILFSGDVTSLVAPATYGYLGVLANHAPMLCTLTPGNITFRNPQGNTTTLKSVAGGFLEIRKNQATLLAERITS